MEADRMRHLRLINSEFEKERQVVIEERRLRGNSALSFNTRD
jgi:predicted Zn-dependent peptidase